MLNILNLHDTGQRLLGLVDRAIERQTPLVIKGQHSHAVLISDRNWKNIQETIVVLSQPGMLDSIRQSVAEPMLQDASDCRHWRLVFSQRARLDVRRLSGSALKSHSRAILDLVQSGPMERRFSFNALVGELDGVYSKKVGVNQRVIFEMFSKEKIVRVLRM